MKSYISRKITVISLLVGFSLPVLSNDSLQYNKDSVLLERPSHVSKYDKRQHYYRKSWAMLIPTQAVLQYAGNMGFISLGIGWDYGKHRQWETQWLFGFLPKYNSKRAKVTMTIKENYIPWSFDLGKGFSLEPLSCGLYVNTIFGHEFWTKQPVRYPNKYYLVSTKIRSNIFVGERVTRQIPENKRKFMKSVTFYYEMSTTDTYLLMKLKNHSIKFEDLVSLSFGLKMQLL
jgi:hypothetical protein